MDLLLKIYFGLRDLTLYGKGRMVMNMKLCKELFFVFFKIGAFTFGGGYAMIPFIKREVVDEKKWLTSEEMFDIIAIAESTPGPLAVNSATFVGSRIAGLKGALAATMGVVLPSFLVILCISQLLLQIEDFQIVKDAFQGIRAGVIVLIGSALISLFRRLHKGAFTAVILIAAFLLTFFFNINTIFTLVFCGLSGIIWNYCSKRGKGR